MKLRKLVAFGTLLGLIIGLYISFMFPDFLVIGKEFNKASNLQLGLPNYTIKSGSVANSLMLVPVVFGIIGGMLGFVASKKCT